MIESGDLTSVELTELMLARIESIDGRLKSYATVMADHAREAARLADEEIRAGTFR
ncbi:MAG: Asp-tRNA(Asn)/Glu-tRNA(Gln) amidotransferase GatCAB subunit A, partial [Phycisphaerae bacterium]|nr:Asp-tRNA(Asn)/Glu-tRNA(Gln) amidotransferase GatCAB subunit A [Phycisphaerae bacterium]